MAEARQQLAALPDEAFGDVLRELGVALAYPSPAAAGQPDIALRARVRIVELGDRARDTSRRRWFGGGVRPMRRGLVLALVALLALAAIAGAVGIGLPGLRIIFGDIPSQRPTPSAASPSPLAPPGSNLGLGTAVSLADAERIAGFDLILPPDPEMGPPDAAYVTGQRVHLVWAPRPALADGEGDGVGLLITEFRGRVDQGYFQKLLNSEASVTPVTVGGSRGYWIEGEHFFFYVEPDGDSVEDTHRMVGDTLLWTSGELTFRIESSLGMEDTIRLAESLR